MSFLPDFVNVRAVPPPPRLTMLATPLHSRLVEKARLPDCRMLRVVWGKFTRRHFQDVIIPYTDFLHRFLFDM